MNINFNEIDIKLLNFLLLGSSYTLQEILKEFSHSKSLIKKSLNKINITLIENNFPSIRVKRGVYSIGDFHRESIKNLIKNNMKYSKDERITHLLFNLLTQETVNLTRLAEDLGYTRKTLQFDLKTSKEILATTKLTLKSHHGKYIKISGNEKDRYIFLISLMVKIILKRKNPAYENIYKALFPKEKLLQFRQFFYEIDSIFPFTIGFKRYCGIIAIFAIYEHFPHISLGKNLLTSITPEESFFVSKYIKNLSNLHIKHIQENILILGYLLSEVDYNFYNYTLKPSLEGGFIKTYEKIYSPLKPKDKIILYTLIKDSIFEKTFNIFENPDIDSYLQVKEKDDFNISIKTILKNCKINISQRSYLKIIMFLNSIRNDNLEIEKNSIENILILDTSLEFWMGNIIKSHLYRNYNLKKIDLKHFLENIKYETYDLVFTLDLPRDRYPKIDATLIPIDWIEFDKNKDYFNRFNFKHL
ncbi:MAG: helix-turn-helix domain-containing protein [Cetobacterium sp.]|nr:helix-turn-helix domain-containing protein [Cetobacterium sp.]